MELLRTWLIPLAQEAATREMAGVLGEWSLVYHPGCGGGFEAAIKVCGWIPRNILIHHERIVEQ